MAATTKGEDENAFIQGHGGEGLDPQDNSRGNPQDQGHRRDRPGGLLRLRQGGPFSDLGSDSCRLVEIVYAAVKPEADILGVTMEKFMESFVGETVVKASEALLESLADFFPGSQGLLIRRALELSGKAKEDADAQLRRFVEETLEKASGRR